ncbi:MAG: hypothetical protein ACI9PY_003763 [Ascidiaceihabitans sp.]
MIHSPPKVVRLAVDFHEHLIQVPLPIRICAHLADPFLADLCGKQRAKSVPPKSNRLIADVDVAFVQKILDIPERKRKPNIHHVSQTDDLGARLEVAKRAAFCHPLKLSARPTRLNKFSSDSVVAASHPIPTSDQTNLRSACHAT